MRCVMSNYEVFGGHEHPVRADQTSAQSPLGGRILSFNLRVAREWVRLQAELRSKAHLMPWEDSIIAASARHHGLTLATHNSADFRHAALRVYDPFTYGRLPADAGTPAERQS